MPFLSTAKDGSVVLRIYVQPKASKPRIIGLYDGLLKIGVASPPVDGKANREVVKLLAKCLRIPKNSIVFKSGLHSRRKVLAVADLKEEEIRRVLKGVLI